MRDKCSSSLVTPSPTTTLPFLVKLPLEGGLVLKAREEWPRTSRVYCHPFEEDWPEDPDVVEQVPVVLCVRRGAAIDLVLDRPRLARSQIVFTEVKGRPAIFWQTHRTARTANPEGRVPRRRALASGFTIAVDSRERYGYRFAGRAVGTEREALPAGDYAVRDQDGVIVAAVERKTLENLASTLLDGTLAFQMQRLAELPLAAVVVEGRYPTLLSSRHVPGAWLGDVLARLQSATPRSRSSSPTPAGSPRNGPTGSWPQRSRMRPLRLRPEDRSWR
jgi:ERCC4 domain